MARRAAVVCLLLTFSNGIQAQDRVPERIVFGGEAGFPPMEWNDQGRARGFNVDLATEIADQGGRDATFRVDGWPDIVRGLNQGTIDVVPMYRSTERERLYLFTDNFYYLHHAIYSRAGKAPARGLEQLQGRKVVVEEASLAAMNMAKEVPKAVVVRMPTTLDTLRAVHEGRADHAVVTTLSADRLIEEYDLDIVQSSKPIWPVGYAFATTRDRPELARWLQHSLAEANASGRAQQIYERWRPELTPSHAQIKAMFFLKVGIATLLSALLLALIWQRSLRRQVEARTQALQQSIREQTVIRSELEYLADHDLDTGLTSAARFLVDVDRALDKAGDSAVGALELAVAKLMDLDEVVRAFGYDRARALVLAFVQRINATPHLHAAHLGRGVFALLMREGDSRALNRDAIAPVEGTLAPRVLIGVSYWPAHGSTAVQLMSRAETALSIGIERKREWTAYRDGMEPDALVLDILAIFAGEPDIDIRPVLQPILSLQTGEITSVEILARWHHPKLGEVAPSAFVPVIEKAGLSPRLTAIMIDHAARIARALADLGSDCIVDVNITAHDLVESALTDTIEAALMKHDCRADRLRLELTETSVASDPEMAKQALERLETIGVFVAVDDFGIGYSSLSSLSLFRFRELKIDRSFVTDMLRNSRHHSIVRSTIAMARELGLSVTAEGVEDEATLQSLNADGCSAVQGYHIAKPMPESDFFAFLHQRKLR
jgi:predicted signal transduction protein with EAL and GGDEF domain/ABC-type amino acid transport substrate-binding protein